MHFTREPVVETVITAREGAKLLVRSARGSTEEADTYLVEAVEVVIFGGAVFYRSASRPSPFLVPVGEYEVIECSSGRVHLKKPAERSSRQSHRDMPSQGQDSSFPAQSPLVEKMQPAPPTVQVGSSRASDEQKSPSPRGKRGAGSRMSNSGRGGRERRLSDPPPFPEDTFVVGEEKDISSQSNEDVVERASKILASLIPPPPVLVSDSLGMHQNKGSFSSSGQETSNSSGGRRPSFKRSGGNRFDRERRGGRRGEAD